MNKKSTYVNQVAHKLPFMRYLFKSCLAVTCSLCSPLVQCSYIYTQASYWGFYGKTSQQHAQGQYFHMENHHKTGYWVNYQHEK